MRLSLSKQPIRFVAVFSVLLVTVSSCAHTRDGCGSPTRGGYNVPIIKPKPWTINVGPSPCTLADSQNSQANAQKQVISQIGKHTITWTAKEARLYIVFHVDLSDYPAKCPIPFDNLKPLNMADPQGYQLYLLTDDQKPGTVSLGPVKPDWPCACDSTKIDCQTEQSTGPGQWQVKYDQYLLDAGSKLYLSCDGWIIIQK